MKTKSSDLDSIPAATNEEIDDFIARYKKICSILDPEKEPNLNDRNLFRFACSLGETKVVKHFLNKINNDQVRVISDTDIKDAFTNLLEVSSGLWSSRIPQNERGDDINREYCFRLLLKAIILTEKGGELWKTSDMVVLDRILNNPLVIRDNVNPLSFLNLAGKSISPSNAELMNLINVLVDELEISGLDLSKANFNKSYTVFANPFPVEPMAHASVPKYDRNLKTEEINYEMLEQYLRLYLKMKYEDKSNKSLYEGIKTFFGYKRPVFGVHIRTFSEKIHEFPRVLAKAYENAEKDLLVNHPKDFDRIKLKKITNEFEKKFTPAVYKIQEEYRVERFWMALLVTVASAGIAAPFVWPWYFYKRAKEPIKATDTTVQAYAKYLEKSQDDISGGISLDKVSNETIQERLAKKEPVKEVKDDSHNVIGYETHKVVHPIKDDKNPDKIRVFSNPFFNQTKKFKEKIRVAEKELKQGSHTRPKA